MGRSRFLSILPVLALLFLSFTQGLGRVLTETEEHQHPTYMAGESAGRFRVTLEVMDYDDPGPNTNPRSGILNPASPAYAPSPSA